MRVPISWLREYVAWDRSVEELAELLSMSGSEVEGIDWVGAPHEPDNLALFRVGRVLTKDRHPNADKLWLCTVDAGPAAGGVHQIVCGADNFAAGDTVAVSLAGATLENGLKLRKANLRGVESDGMMLSEQELGFEQASPGIVVLPAEWPVGAPLAEYLPVAEAVLEIEVTPNRPDCLSVYGVAREVAAAARLALAPPPVAEPPASGAPAEAEIAVEIADPDLCARYGARVIRGVTVSESPAWLKARLTHAGMRPINNVVDVTNYVMLAVGQPLHGFDAAKIRGGKLIARRARAGERIVTLDGIDRALRADNLVIADTERALVIAGIFGAVDAEVDDAHHRPGTRGGHLQRTEHHAHLQRGGLAQRGQHSFREGTRSLLRAPRTGHGEPPVLRAVRRCGRAGERRRLGAAAPGAAASALPAEPLRRAARPAGRAARASRHPASPGVRGRTGDRRGAGRRSRPRRHAATVSPRPRAAGRPGRGGRPHPRAREPARDAAAAARRDRPADRRAAGAPPHRRHPDRGRPRRGRRLVVRGRRRARAVGARHGRPARDTHRPRQPDERRPGGHAHDAAPRAAGRRGGQPGPSGRAGRVLRAGARLPAEGRPRPAGARARSQGHLPAVAGRRARDAGRRALRAGSRGELDGGVAPDRLLYHQGVHRALAGRPRHRRRRLRALA